MRTFRVIVLVAAMVAPVVASPARAFADGAARGGINNGDPIVAVGREGSNPDAGSGGGSSLRCSYTPLPVGPEVDVGIPGYPAVVREPGWLERWCFTANGSIFGPPEFIPPRDPAQVARELAAQALARLQIPAPSVGTSPASNELLVNLVTWLWIPGAQWDASLSATASVPGVSATVQAHPIEVRWDMGDGGVVTCSGPGRAWEATRLDSNADCSYTYRRSSAAKPGRAFALTATVSYRVDWSAEGAPGGGALDGVTRSTTVQARVAEAQAIGSQG